VTAGERVAPVLVAALVLLGGGSGRAAQEPEIITLPTIEVVAPHPLTAPRYQTVTRPAYPEVSRARGEQGTVLLLVKVLSDGRAGEVRLKRSSGHPALDTAAQEAVAAWRFVPGRRGPRPVETWVDIPIRFELTDRE
jgi:protein TonB